MRTLVIVGCAVALAASGASAQVIADFEGGVNPFSAGAIVVDPEDAGNNCLLLGLAVQATYDIVAGQGAALAPGKGISMKVYDHARSCMDDLTDPMNPVPAADSRATTLGYQGGSTVYGWRICVRGASLASKNYGFLLTNKSFSGANGGYGYAGSYFDGFPQTGSVFSYNFFGGPRQVGPGGLSLVLSGTIEAPEVPGDGAWSTWIIGLLPGGNVLVENVEMGVQKVIGIDDGSDAAPPNETGLDLISLYGGRSLATGDGLRDVWVDDVEIVDVEGPPPPLQADFDGDGDVDLDDFVILKNNFGLTPPANGDADGDGDVDLDDFVILKTEFGT